MSTMRIAVAGTGGLAVAIASHILTDTSHQVIVLSRCVSGPTHKNDQADALQAKPSLVIPCQVAVVEYSQPRSLEFALKGVDTVISTVLGPNQIELLKAAVAVKVRRFAPAEFGGLPALRTSHGKLERGKTMMQEWTNFYSTQIVTTSFCCGVFYEHFQPGGMRQSGMSLNWALGAPGAYMIDFAKMDAQVPCYNSLNGVDVYICMTALDDVARFVTKALDLETWPPVMTMRGERVGVKDLVLAIQNAMGQQFTRVRWHDADSLQAELGFTELLGDVERQVQLHALIATAEGQYDFVMAGLNERFPEIRPVAFQEWFARAWNLNVPGLSTT